MKEMKTDANPAMRRNYVRGVGPTCIHMYVHGDGGVVCDLEVVKGIVCVTKVTKVQLYCCLAAWHHPRLIGCLQRSSVQQ